MADMIKKRIMQIIESLDFLSEDELIALNYEITEKLNTKHFGKVKRLKDLKPMIGLEFE